MTPIFHKFALNDYSFYGVAELKYESRCREVALLRLYKDFGIRQNRFHTWNQQRPFSLGVLGGSFNN
ncbi:MULTISPECIES: hypothetical protein [unclassified Nostoc]|uniref:hypothetical protein n=1 Tax=unclassified Nostoc TaxID=2593658 RepID=UPI002AD54FDA|nr:hypothetical protein [Nostoc sp. DedQUE03]MDZ7972361.1 hypothetical protein [Nostoc sp. DedQUE03]MDZ8044993.1 hypothetical protein [Nostoc sp. DedQUE02]